MTSSDAKSGIFASIRENLAASIPFDAAHHAHPVRIEKSPILNAPNADLVEGFRQSLELVGARCTLVKNEDEGAQHLREIVEKLSAKEVVISESELVRRLINKAGIDAIQDASRDELFASDVGVTSAQWAIAETGTLVLESAAERHRLVSLVPPVHVCILSAVSIRQSMSEILQVVDAHASPTITFITGASRTSDIELTLAIGVHGPGELHVIVIKDQ